MDKSVGVQKEKKKIIPNDTYRLFFVGIRHDKTDRTILHKKSILIPFLSIHSGFVMLLTKLKLTPKKV